MKSKKPDPSSAAAPPPATFEESFSIVEGAVEQLERGNLSLEDSLREYERGLSALKQCYSTLERAQKRIEVLGVEVGVVAEGVSGLYWKPAASHPALGEAADLLGSADDSDETLK